MGGTFFPTVTGCTKFGPQRLPDFGDLGDQTRITQTVKIIPICILANSPTLVRFVKRAKGTVKCGRIKYICGTDKFSSVLLERGMITRKW